MGFASKSQSAALQLNYIAGRNVLLEQGKELRVANAALERLSLIDPLTSIPNRRRFNAALDEVWRRAVRKCESVALMSIDVNFFKGANDRHGHAYGESCLTAVAQVLDKQAGRPYDLLARYGGETSFFCSYRIQGPTAQLRSQSGSIARSIP